MRFQVIQGHVLDALKGLPAGSIQTCVTSPPYYGLRDYGIAPSIWGGDPICAHRWEDSSWKDSHGQLSADDKIQQRNGGSAQGRGTSRESAFCSRCSAWRGCLGLEPSVGLYIEHMVEVFREVWRVLRDSGTLWMNLGDSYCSDAGADRVPTTTAGPRVPAGWTNRSQPTRIHSAYRRNADRDPKRGAASGDAILQGVRAGDGLKAKDLAMMPARVALALQADGWYLRSQIPWMKSCPMPESVTDRPTSAVEYIFLLAKSENYFYDREAVREAASGTAHARGGGVNPKAMGPNSRMRSDKDPYHQVESWVRCKQNRSFSAAVAGITSTRARRNSDWFFASITSLAQGALNSLAAGQPVQSFQGLLVDDNADPLAMLVNPQPFSIEMCGQCKTVYEQKEYRKLPENADKRRVCACGAVEWISHFATFPTRMVEPMLAAGTSERGCCAECGAPWERILESAKVGDWHPDPKHKHDAGAVNGTAKWAKGDPQASGARMNGNVSRAREARNGDPPHSVFGAASAIHNQPFAAPATLGWRPTCSHPLFSSEPVPCCVLDPFSGSGRTGLAAMRLGLDYIGVEANPNYVIMSNWQAEKLQRESGEEVSTVTEGACSGKE